MNTADNTQTVWSPERDDYGRSTHAARRAGRTVGMVVRLPKMAWELHDGNKYLANAWRRAEDGRGLITYHPTLKIAKEWVGKNA